MPEIYHNAWRLADDGGGVTGELQIVQQQMARLLAPEDSTEYLPITRPSLCACSALPYVEQTVQIPNDDGRHYSEGALVDTVSFRNLVEDHPDLDEIWVCRIVDYRQLRLQKNLHDSLGNLCQQFAAEVGENDIKLFKSHLRKSAGRTPRVVEIPLKVETKIDYRWDHENLDIGCVEGWNAVMELMEEPELQKHVTSAPPWQRHRISGAQSRLRRLSRRFEQGRRSVLASLQIEAVAARQCLRVIRPAPPAFGMPGQLQ